MSEFSSVTTGKLFHCFFLAQFFVKYGIDFSMGIGVLTFQCGSKEIKVWNIKKNSDPINKKETFDR